MLQNRGAMPALRWLLLSIAALYCTRTVQSVAVTRQGGIVSCSLLTNSATAVRLNGSLQGESAPIKELSQLLVRYLISFKLAWKAVLVATGCERRWWFLQYTHVPAWLHTEMLRVYTQALLVLNDLCSLMCFSVMFTATHESLRG